MLSTLASAILLVTLLLLSLAPFITKRPLNMSAGQEPPPATSPIPLIGHVVGLMRHNFNYYVELSKRHADLPIFTLSLPGQKMYVVTKPELIQAVQRLPKILSFPIIEAKFASTVCGTSKKAQSILEQNLNCEQGNFGLSYESYAAMRDAMKPGSGLDEMNARMIQDIVAAFDAIKPEQGASTVLHFSSWLRKSITLATTSAVYGPDNPFKDESIVDAFWQFEAGLMSILIGFLPSWTAAKPIAARERVSQAFERYYRCQGHERASAYAKDRYQVEINHNIPLEDIAKYEVGGAIAVLVNTTPAAFWMLLLVYMRPALLHQLRAELDAVIRTETATKHFDVTRLKSDCPLLVSTYQEVLRYCSMGTSVRHVTEDTLLDGRWLLKKDAMLQMPSRIIHSDARLWGNDVNEFNPRRFMKGEVQQTETGKRPPNACFRAFGGGATLCPGRHFASNEVLAVVSLFITRYNMAPTSGQWEEPSTGNTNAAATIMEPDTDVEVLVTCRPGFEDVEWRIELGASNAIFSIVAEDKAVDK